MPGLFAGRKVRIKYDADGAGVGTPVEIARAKSDSLTINNEPIDGTTKDSAGVREYLSDLAMQSVSMACSGLATDQHKTMIGLIKNSITAGAALHWFEFDMPDIGKFRGQFIITSTDLAGENGDGTATFSMSLESSGAVTWTATP